MHPNPRDETHLFSYSAKSLDIAGPHHKNQRYIASATHQSTLATPVASMCDPTGSKTVSRDHPRTIDLKIDALLFPLRFVQVGVRFVVQTNHHLPDELCKLILYLILETET